MMNHHQHHNSVLDRDHDHHGKFSVCFFNNNNNNNNNNNSNRNGQPINTIADGFKWLLLLLINRIDHW